jgi:flagellar motor protein MotB
MKEGIACSRIRSRGAWSAISAFPGNQDAAGDESLWLITFSDLMSLLLVFFLVWTATHISIKAGNEQKPLPMQLEEPEPLEELQSTILPVAPVEVRGGTVVVILQEELNFEPGQARLKPDGDRILERVASVLRKKAAHYQIEILGHTDNMPIKSGQWESNLQLSLARATSVWESLVEYGISPTRLKIQGLGSLCPALSNDTRAHRSENRRVELLLRPA